MRRISRQALCLMTLLGAAFFSGCASFGAQQAFKKNVTETRLERERETVESFEVRRDQAQLLAALDRWQDGDIGGCENRLRSLIGRRPDWIEPHIRLAELAWACDDLPGAETHYRTALALDAGRADILHALGTVLEAAGRSDEAAGYLAQASQLEPANPLYQLASQANPAQSPVIDPAAARADVTNEAAGTISR